MATLDCGTCYGPYSVIISPCCNCDDGFASSFRPTVCFHVTLWISKAFGRWFFFYLFIASVNFGVSVATFSTVQVIFPLHVEVKLWRVGTTFYSERNIVALAWRIWSRQEIFSRVVNRRHFGITEDFFYQVVLIAGLFTLFFMTWHQDKSYHSWEV